MLRLLAVLSLIGLGAGCSSPVIHQNYYASAQYYFDKGEWSDSIEMTKLALKQDGANEDAYLLLAMGLSKSGELTEAHQLLHERLSLRPHSTKLNFALVNWHKQFGSRTAALEVAKRMIERDHSNLEAHKTVAELSIELENWQDAEASLSKIFKHDKFEESSAMALGKLYLKQKRLGDAQVVFNRLYEGKNFRIESAKYLAWIHADNGNVQDANKFIRFLSVEKQNDPFIDKIITRNLLNLPDVDKITVLGHYTKNHKDDWGQHQMYLALVGAGYKEKALDLLADAWNQSPDKKWAAINYANHLYETGDHKVAESILEKASVGTDQAEQDLIANTRKTWSLKEAPVAPARAVANVSFTHKVKHGETLGGIAHKYLGDAQRWPEIYKLNTSKIKNEAILSEGIELTIPQEQK